jgi:hypothetical protein
MSARWRDRIVSETRRIREEYGGRFHYGIEAICRATCAERATSGRNVVTLPPKPAPNGAHAASVVEVESGR